MTAQDWIVGFVMLLITVCCHSAAEEAAAPGAVPAGDWFTPRVITDAEPKLLDQEGGGKLYQVGELLVCVLEGSPREMG